MLFRNFMFASVGCIVLAAPGFGSTLKGGVVYKDGDQIVTKTGEIEYTEANIASLKLRLSEAENLADKVKFKKFDLENRSVIGVEALIRWDHPTRGLVNPVDFIPAAEDTDLILPIGRWVLNEACQQGAVWHAAGYHVAMSVNVSSRQLADDAIIEDVRTALATSGLRPGSLILEVTESAIMEDAMATAARLAGLKTLGVRIAIDDFGTGYSSLAYLQQFPVDTLKIDRSFVAAMTDSRESRALVHTLVQLGKTLGLETIAEGIEETSQLRHLQGEACDAGQGFLFAHPLEPSAATAFFVEHGIRAEPVVAAL